MADRRFKLINAGLTESEIADADALYLLASAPVVANDVYYQGTDTGGTAVDILTLNSSNRVILKNTYIGEDLRIQATATGDTLQNGMIFDPDGKMQLYHGATNSVAIHTQDHTAADRVSSILMVAADGTNNSVGEALQRFYTRNVNHTIVQADHGKIFYKGNTASPAYTTPASTDTDVPTGFWIKGVVQGTNAITVVPGSGVNLRFAAGTGAPAGGTRTVAQGGFFTLHKRSDTEYYIEGVGIT